MVEISVEIGGFGRFVKFHAEEAVFVQVHGPRKGSPYLVYAVYFLNLCFPRFLRLFHTGNAVYFLYVRKDIGMSSHKGFQGVFKLLEVYGGRQFEQQGLLVVAGFFVQSLAGQEHAQLCLGKGGGHSQSFFIQNTVTS